MHGELVREDEGGHIAELTRIGQEAGDGGHSGQLGGYQIDLAVLGAGAAEEVAVEGTQRDAAGIRRLAHADAGAARALEDAGAGVDHDGEQTHVGHHIEHLLGAGRDGELHIRVNGLALEDVGDLHHIEEGGVGAGADADLVDLQLAAVLRLDLGNGLDVVGGVRTCRLGYEGGQVDLDGLVVDGIVIGLLLAPDLAAALCLEEGLGDLIGGEDGGGGTELGAHVGDGGTLRDGEGLDALADVLDDLADAALDGHAAQHLKDDVLGSDPRRELAGQLDLDDLRIGDVVGTAAHGHGHIQTAGADGDHADAAAGGGMGVGADEGLARDAEALEVYLMADAVAGTGEPDAVLLGDGADEAVVIHVHEAVLEGVVVDVGHAALGAHARHADGLKFEIRHGAGGILGERLVDADADLLSLDRLAVHKVRTQDLFGQCQTHCRSFLSIVSPPRAEASILYIILQ